MTTGVAAHLWSSMVRFGSTDIARGLYRLGRPLRPVAHGMNRSLAAGVSERMDDGRVVYDREAGEFRLEADADADITEFKAGMGVGLLRVLPTVTSVAVFVWATAVPAPWMLPVVLVGALLALATWDVNVDTGGRLVRLDGGFGDE